MTPALIFTLAFIVAAPAPKETPKESPKLEGDWAVESVEPAKKGPGDLNATFRFSKGKLSILEAKRGKPEDADISVDLKKKPATIDIKPANAPPDLVVKGIIEIKGDKMKLCFTRVGERPSEFKADAKNGRVLINLKRMKPEK